MSYRVVCISRVTASGADAIGPLVAERLGFRFVDDEILELAAAHAGLDPKQVAGVEHHKGRLARLMDALFSPPPEIQGYLSRRPRQYGAEPAPQAMPSSDELRALIKQAIADTAERGGAVIMAHAASMALAGRPDVLRVHVTASRPTRIERLRLTSKLLDEADYETTVDESDRQRREYLARFYGVEDESIGHYDLVVNTDGVGIETAVAAIAAAAGA